MPPEQALPNALSTSATPIKRLVVFGLPYSPNTGDGVISDCLIWALQRHLPETDITALDLSGRRSSGDVVVRNRSLLLGLPSPLRKIAVLLGLTLLTRRLNRFWTPVLSKADAVLIGGGQIFSDADLNFPMKIATVAACCKTTARPLGIVAAGVSDNWSRRGRKLFSRLLTCDLRYVGLRDAESIEAWTAQIASKALEHPVLARDPGLLAAGCYGLEGLSISDESPVAIGISDAMILRHHANKPIAGLGTATTSDGLHGYFVDMAKTLVQRGHRVRLFCNGAIEDAAFLENIAKDKRLAQAFETGQLECAAPPRNGKALAEIIAPCKGVIAHRLHACILAYAFRRPAVGLSWDSKLDSFFASINAAERISRHLEPEHPCDLLEDALSVGIPERQHADVLGQCTQNIARAIAACGVAAVRPQGESHV